SEVEFTKRRDQAIEVMLRDPDAPPAAEDQKIADLLSIALEVRQLPRTEFRARLREELEREVSMSTAKESIESGDQLPSKEEPPAKTREGVRTVTPYVVVSDVHQVIDFIKKAFGAAGKVYGLGSQGGYHSEYRIGDSMLMIGGGGKGSRWKGTPVPVSLHVYVADVHGVYQNAVQAGATSLMPPADMHHGERGAAIEDVGGNHWYLATAVGPTYVPEGLPNLMPYFNPRGA